MNRTATRAPRARGTAALAVVVGLSLLGVGGLAGLPAAAASPAAASTSAAGPSQATLQAEADALAGQIRSQSVQINQLAEQADGAQLAEARAGAQLARARTVKAETDAEMVGARRTLRAQALAAYTEDGRTATPQLVPLGLGANRVLADGYAEIVAGGQRGAIAGFRLAEHQQADATRALLASQAQAAGSVVQLHQARAAAETAQAGEQRTLGSVTGQLAAMVSAAEAAQARTEAAQEQATLASEHDLPDPPTGTGTVPAPAVAGPAGSSTPVTPSATAAPSATTPRPASATTTRAPVAATPATPAPVPAAPATDAPAAAAPAPASPAPTTAPTTAPAVPQLPAVAHVPAVPQVEASGASVAIAWAEAQLGKPYQWGGAGPSTFDCSGLVMDAWGAAGVSFPHLAQDQYDMTARVAVSQLLPGDLVFFGTPSDVYHVGIYVGGGQMVDAPETGQNVSIQSIYWTDLLGGGRVA